MMVEPSPAVTAAAAVRGVRPTGYRAEGHEQVRPAAAVARRAVPAAVRPVLEEAVAVTSSVPPSAYAGLSKRRMRLAPRRVKRWVDVQVPSPLTPQRVRAATVHVYVTEEGSTPGPKGVRGARKVRTPPSPGRHAVRPEAGTTGMRVGRAGLGVCCCSCPPPSARGDGVEDGSEPGGKGRKADETPISVRQRQTCCPAVGMLTLAVCVPAPPTSTPGGRAVRIISTVAPSGKAGTSNEKTRPATPAATVVPVPDLPHARLFSAHPRR
jgi:hypothetical protein